MDNMPAKNSLLQEIENKRQQLNDLYKNEKYLLSKVLLEKSKELDELILRYLKLFEKK